ncbi:hypothetical protein, partial [Haemophilus parainfluenzae]|uniref:hypothetical protein n=1 Tax=Haemophilus parainfluenzae TaxID=729 RepID=UPI001CED1C9A
MLEQAGAGSLQMLGHVLQFGLLLGGISLDIGLGLLEGGGVGLLLQALSLSLEVLLAALQVSLLGLQGGLMGLQLALASPLGAGGA